MNILTNTNLDHDLIKGCVIVDISPVNLIK